MSGKLPLPPPGLWGALVGTSTPTGRHLDPPPALVTFFSATQPVPPLPAPGYCPAAQALQRWGTGSSASPLPLPQGITTVRGLASPKPSARTQALLPAGRALVRDTASSDSQEQTHLDGRALDCSAHLKTHFGASPKTQQLEKGSFGPQGTKRWSSAACTPNSWIPPPSRSGVFGAAKAQHP